MPHYRLPAFFLTAALAAPLAAQQPLPTDGTSVTGEITAQSQVVSETVQYTDLYTIEGEAGERIAIELNSDAFDSYLEIGRMEDGQFVSLRSDDDGGGDLNSRLVFSFPESGSYIVRARPLGSGSLGSYLIQANRLGPPAPPPAPVALTVGSTREGEFTLDSPTYTANDYGADRHYALYSVRGNAGDTVTVSLSSEDFDSYLEAGGMTPIGFAAATTNDDGEYLEGEEPNLDSRLTVTFAEAGTLLIRATTLQGGNVGSYRLSIEGE